MKKVSQMVEEILENADDSWLIRFLGITEEELANMEDDETGKELEDKIKETYQQMPDEELQKFLKEIRVSNFDYNDIEEGDLVDFGSYGKLYVVNTDAGLVSDDLFWVTDNEEERTDRQARGWYIKKRYAKRIIEKFEEEDDEEFYDDED